MSGISRKLLGTTPAAGGQIDISAYFSTYLYTGNGSTQTITNGIDLAGEGGLVWIKSRTSTTSNWLMDTERGMNGVDAFLSSNTSNPAYDASSNGLTPNVDGFSHVSGNSDLNASGTNYASWTFRKAPRFFDVVTYTGDGSGSDQLIAHNLGVTPGCIIVKRTDGTSDWLVWHRGTAATTDKLYLNRTDAVLSGFGDGIAFVTDERFFAAGTNAATDYHINVAGEQYVAYLFAHDPLGPSGDGSDGLIACGSYSGNGSTQTISLGWEPQFVIIKKAAGTGDEGWIIQDVMRGMIAAGATHDDRPLFANSATAESSINNLVGPTATGFFLERGDGAINASGSTYIYIAIRRGPMRQPESGTEVFDVQANLTGSRNIGDTVSTSLDYADWHFARKTDVSYSNYNEARLTGWKYLRTEVTNSEAGPAVKQGGNQNELEYVSNWSSGFADPIDYFFKRAPSFFDVVAYTGDGVAGRTVPHNLGVAPELMIVKRRDTTGGWVTYHGDTGNNAYLLVNTADATQNTIAMWNNTTPTESVFTLGTSAAVNASGGTYIAYLFATLAGVSKVGSYTGNGTSQTIDCGFTSGARFVLIKRTDSTGDWYVWDTARGIVTGNDPFLELNTTDAEVTSDDSIDPDSSGFIVNQTATTNVNVSSASYIYLAVS